MFAGLFNLDRPFWRWMNRIPQILLLSLLFYICCIPIVTIIPAACALFDAISRCTVPDEKGCYERFFRTFRNELKRGIPLTIFWIVIAFIALYGDQILSLNAGINNTMTFLSLAYRMMILLTAGFFCWIVPLESRYYHSFLRLHLNALSFFFGRLPGTGCMIFCSAAVIIFSIASPYTAFLLVFAPGLIAVLHSFTVEKAFQKAFPEDYENGQLRSNQENQNQ